MIKRFLVPFAILLAVVALPTTESQAQTLRIGYADPELIIQYMPDYQNIQRQLAQEVQTGQQALQALAEDFQERVARYERQKPLLSPERQAEREQELGALQAEIQQSAEAKDAEIAARQEELMAPLLDRVQSVIDQVATEKNLDVVLRSPALLFVKEDRIVNLNLDIASRLGIEIEEDDTTPGN
ncbi:MAG: OmpH family outer membrane protein [Rhodothermales bacterium]